MAQGYNSDYYFGVQGYAGRGPTGNRGPIGNNGPIGITTGYQGMVGVQGYVGPTGATGASIHSQFRGFRGYWPQNTHGAQGVFVGDNYSSPQPIGQIYCRNHSVNLQTSDYVFKAIQESDTQKIITFDGTLPCCLINLAQNLEMFHLLVLMGSCCLDNEQPKLLGSLLQVALQENDGVRPAHHQIEASFLEEPLTQTTFDSFDKAVFAGDISQIRNCIKNGAKSSLHETFWSNKVIQDFFTKELYAAYQEMLQIKCQNFLPETLTKNIIAEYLKSWENCQFIILNPVVPDTFMDVVLQFDI